jgi:hypothetical protein
LEGFVILDAFPFLGDSMTDYGVAAIHDVRLSLSGHVTDESEIEEGVRDVAQVVDPDTGDLHGVHCLDELDNVGSHQELRTTPPRSLQGPKDQVANHFENGWSRHPCFHTSLR